MLLHIAFEGELDRSKEAILGLENLARAGIEGRHVVAGDRGALEAIFASPINSEAKAYYRRISQSLTQIGHVLSSLDKIQVDASLVSANDGVPVSVFADADYCEKAQFLVENLTDYEVLVGFAKACLSSKYKGFEIRLRAHNGGGSTTAQVLNHLAEAACGPVLCVVDSDRRFRGCAVGDTALSANRAYRRARSSKWRLRFKMLESRELENLVPHDVRELATQSLADPVKSQVQALVAAEPSFFSYCDLKSGDSLCRMVCDVIRKRHHHLIAPISELDANGLEQVSPCGTCPTGRCFSSPALGQNFLQRVAQALHGPSPETSIAGWSSELREIVEAVCHVGLALAPQRL